MAKRKRRTKAEIEAAKAEEERVKNLQQEAHDNPIPEEGYEAPKQDAKIEAVEDESSKVEEPKVILIKLSNKDRNTAYKQATEQMQAVKEADYAVFYDDLSFDNDDIKKFVELFEGIKDSKKVALSLYELPFAGGQWGSGKAQRKGDYYLSGWVDNNFIANRQFFEDLEYKVEAPPAKWNPNNTSNGVGGNMTTRTKGNLYHL